MDRGKFSQAVEVLKLIKDQDPEEEDLRDLINLGLLSDIIRAVSSRAPIDRDQVRRGYCLPPRNGINLVVDYDQDPCDLAKAGKYKVMDDEFKKRVTDFGTKIREGEIPAETRTGQREVHFELLPYRHMFTLGEVEPGLTERKLRPASRSEILTFGRDCQYVQTRFCVFTYFVVPPRSENRVKTIELVPYDNKGNVMLEYSPGWDQRDKFSYILAVRK